MSHESWHAVFSVDLCDYCLFEQVKSLSLLDRVYVMLVLYFLSLSRQNTSESWRINKNVVLPKYLAQEWLKVGEMCVKWHTFFLFFCFFFAHANAYLAYLVNEYNIHRMVDCSWDWMISVPRPMKLGMMSQPKRKCIRLHSKNSKICALVKSKPKSICSTYIKNANFCRVGN